MSANSELSDLKDLKDAVMIHLKPGWRTADQVANVKLPADPSLENLLLAVLNEVGPCAFVESISADWLIEADGVSPSLRVVFGVNDQD